MTTFISKKGRRRADISLSARFLNEHLPKRIGCAGQNEQVFCKWPPRSPDLTVCDFFLWGYVKDRVNVSPHYPQPWMNCRNASLQLLTRSRRICCRESGLSYMIASMCTRITRGGRIECVWYHMKLYEFVEL